MNISVVICTHNRRVLLAQTLQWLSNAVWPEDHRANLLVVANACTDDTVAWLRQSSASQTQDGGLPLTIVEELTPGKSYALNRAIAESTADALCFVDDDQLVDRNFLTELLAALDRYHDCGIICGKMAPAWDGTEPGWVHETGKYRIPIRPFPEYDYGDAPKLVDETMRRPSGGNITVRKAVFERAGGFSVDIGPHGHNLMGGEDHEFLARATAAGVKIMYVPTIKQLHTIDRERMSMWYMMRKSYLRSLSSTQLFEAQMGLRPFMVIKVLKYFLRGLTSINANRRFYYFIRLAASFGELRGFLQKRPQS